MDSPQSVVSPLKSSSIFPDSEKQNSNTTEVNNFQRKQTKTGNLDDFIGALEIYIHQARDIHNICIYQKQDVYAKLCLTSDLENTVSTKIINGGGRNPIFNENLSLNVRKPDSSLKCEIWMLSRVRNYLEDQLLGFALVPISEILLENGKLEKEFSLSSTDLFHSPAGFVHLSVSYIGSPPDVFNIPPPLKCVETDSAVQERESLKSLSNDMDKIEFPDPKVVNENHQMVEEYFSLPCANVDSPSSDSFISSENTENHHENGTNGTSSASVPVSFESSESETQKDPKSPDEEHISAPQDKDNHKEKSATAAESNASCDTVMKPLVSVNIEPETKMVQQDIVDMYMKSMQQFTDSLAKMKLPMDFENGPTSSENSTSSDPKSPASKNSGSRVFYGSRAFF